MTSSAAAGTAPQAQPGEWVADLAACTVSFTVRNFGLRSVTGQIPLASASVTVGPGGQPVSVRAELDARGIDTAPAFLVGHMISLSLTMRLRPPAIVPGLSRRRTPDTTAPAKEERI